MARRGRREPLGTGYAILCHDNVEWFAGGDSTKALWVPEVRNAVIYDAEATAAAKIDEGLSKLYTQSIFEIVPVDRDAVFGA